MKKGWKRCITFVLAISFLLSSAMTMPILAAEAEDNEGQPQVQTESTEAVEDSEENGAPSVDSIPADNADSNAVTIPDENAESSVDPTEEETAGGESSEDDESQDATTQESQIESSQEDESQVESSQEEDSRSDESNDDSIEMTEAQIEAEQSLEAMSLFSNSNLMMLSMNAGIAMMSLGANDSNMGLAAGIAFHKFEIEYNKYDTNTVEYIVIHDTGNPGVGADAMAHYNYFKGGDRDASAHYFVDDHQVVQIIDDQEGSWHSGVKYKTPATPISNHNSIGIEMCINADGDYNKAMKNTIDLAAYLLWKYDLNMDHLVRHYDANGKVCPKTMSESNWARWDEFKKAVQAKRGTYSGHYSGDDVPTSDEGVHYSNAIMGSSTMSADAMAAYLMEGNSTITKEKALQVADAYLTIGGYYGIRGDIAFFQAMLETGRLTYGGEVDASYNNFCGMKAAGDTETQYTYAKFATVEEGVEAHIQHLYCYASTNPIPEGRPHVDPRFGDWLRGKSTTWEGLSGIWAVPGYDPKEYASLSEAQDKHGTYGDIIVRMYASSGGTNVQTGPAIKGSLNTTAEESYWNNPIYTGGAAGTRNQLALGSTGNDVKELQGYLITIGYSYVTQTGSFDANTQRAVKDIQAKKQLTTDGVVGEKTWAAVINSYVNAVLKNEGRLEYPDQNFNDQHVPGSTPGTTNPAPTTPAPTTPSTPAPAPAPAVPVISVSGRSMVYMGCTGSDVTALQQLLNRLGYNLATDGIFGSGTNAAVLSFQKKYGLAVDGYVGPASWKVLGEKANPTSGGSTPTTPAPTTPTTPAPTTPTTPSISVTGRSMVSYGSTGGDVTALQQLLNVLGYGLATDGIFGGGTNSAVRSFQSKQGLAVDGYVGPATWAALGKACGGSSAPAAPSAPSTPSNGSGISTSGRPNVGYGDTGANVTALQQLLNQYGFGLATDGIFGSATYAAVRSFQSSKGLVADGIVGPLTWGKL